VIRISFFDDQGEKFPLSQSFCREFAQALWRWSNGDAKSVILSGDIRYSYRVFPRELPKDYQLKPLF
jgi:hypothetical protein